MVAAAPHGRRPTSKVGWGATPPVPSPYVPSPCFSANASRSRFHVVSRSSGSTRVSATVVISWYRPPSAAWRAGADAGHAGAGGLAHVHPEIEAMRRVDPFQGALRPLRQVHQLVRGFGGQRGQPVEMRVRHDHHVARGVGKGVQADKAVLPAQNQAAGRLGFSRSMPFAMA